ncbi:hypothetical protein [Halarcobacter sp.]|uniref:hypothetical protein n=1 Tax=Halarcobacter sp. TaxID=2321133 RepID=UPI002AA8AFBD|nr:hypothetical protein [Halarcobacter sp.]
MDILSFIERVNIAIQIVKEGYPEAKLYEVGGVVKSNEPTTDPNKIDQLRVVFQNIDNSTVIIKESDNGKFDRPVFIPEPWLEDSIIDWPINMDLSKANELKEKAGYKNSYLSVTLRTPLDSVPRNPYFIFMGDVTVPSIFVNTITGEVKVGSF